MATWEELFAQRISVEQAAPLLSRAGADLDGLLANTPHVEEHVLAILEKRLGGTIDADTWTAVDAALANYLGGAAALVSWVGRADQTNRLHEAETRVPPLVAGLLRTILGLYGRELRLAYERWRELPNDWVRMNRDVFYDEIEKRYLLRVAIEKQNGETFVLEARPGSMLRLITSLVVTAKHASTPGAFDPPSITAFNEAVGQLQQLFAPPPDQPTPAS